MEDINQVSSHSSPGRYLNGNMEPNQLGERFRFEAGRDQDMLRAKRLEPEVLPKNGKVNEMCRQWLVHEDGAFAYQLQSQEINQHYSQNKNRNAQIREDLPCAMDEQIREQQMAEQAAAVYHRMLQEQEEVDKQIAQKLADKIEREERNKRRALELHDEEMAMRLLEKERTRSKHASPHKLHSTPLQTHHASPHRPDASNYFANLPKRQAPAMPLPLPDEYNDLYTEPYKPEKDKQMSDMVDDFDRIDIQEVGLPIEVFEEKLRQEEKDAALARQLQDELSNSEESILDRDRMLAIEAQDKELAKLLQERERAKAKRAKERAKQKALAKKQLQQQQQQLEQEHQMHQLMPDDSYSSPIDLLPQPQRNVGQSMPKQYMANEEDNNYSYPVDVITGKHQFNTSQHSSLKSYDTRFDAVESNGLPNYANDGHGLFENVDHVPPPIRPTQLDLRSPLTQKINKPRFPDPIEEPPSPQSPQTPENYNQSPSKHGNMLNIAMAIDPTYPRRTKQSPPSYDMSSGTVTTSTSSSSPGMMLPTPDLHDDDPSPVPPYMPIQGQRRTASLEKKSKKKGKDGCKQQ